MSSERRDIRHDPALGMQAVFQPVQRGRRKKLDITVKWGAATINWRGPDVLSVSDQSVLFAVLEVAQALLLASGHQMGVGASDPMWKLLRHSGGSYSDETLCLDTSFSQLARCAGWSDGGSSLKRVRSGLQRMTETTVWVQLGDKVGSSRLLAWQIGDSQRVRLAVNWRLAQALHGRQYARVSMRERAQLKSEVAVILHAVLSCKVDPGRRWSCGLDKLQVHVWGDAVEGAALRGRRRKLRAALLLVDALPGWKVRMDGATASIGRQSKFHQPHQKDGRTKEPKPVASATLRRIEAEIPSLPTRAPASISSKDAAFRAVDASALFSPRE